MLSLVPGWIFFILAVVSTALYPNRNPRTLDEATSPQMIIATTLFWGLLGLGLRAYDWPFWSTYAATLCLFAAPFVFAGGVIMRLVFWMLGILKTQL